MIVRLLLLLVFAYAVARVLLWVSGFLKSLEHQSEASIPRGRTAINEMVRDPVCGVYITDKDSITAVVNGKEFHFCSVECRRKFIDDQG